MSWSLMDRMLPAPVGGGFRMEHWWVWCGSVVRGEDGRYHMFASRWPKWLPMHPGWLIRSEIVRAVSDTPEGPYTYAETVLPARGAEYWDGRSTHNPHIIRQGDQYLLLLHGLDASVCGSGAGGNGRHGRLPGDRCQSGQTCRSCGGGQYPWPLEADGCPDSARSPGQI